MRRETIYYPPKQASKIDNNFHLSSDEESLQSLNEATIDHELKSSNLPIPGDKFLRHHDGASFKTKKLFIDKAKIIIAHGGLVVLLIAYLLVGATVFHYLEAPNEILVRDREISSIFAFRDSYHKNIWNLTQSNDTVISQESFNAIGQEYFEKLVTNIFSAYRNQFINERHLLNRTEGDEMLWTYANSVFFSTTVLTTIGYGNLVPATKVGRIVCICFALFGIPLLLITIADIGKFLSDLLGFFYRRYHEFKRKVRKQSMRLSRHNRSITSSRASSQQGSSMLSLKGGSINLNEIIEPTEDGTYEEDEEDKTELRIPMIMVIFVLVAYTALGGLIFQRCENWPYFDAFYFCFITMTTVGFGDIVPSEQVYIFFTMAYIVFGLSLTTMCIDLAGTEYIRKIHYLGTKMEDAKGAVLTGFQVGKHTGIEVFRTAGGKLVQVRGAVLNSKQARELGVEYILANLQYQQQNVLYEPLSPAVQKLIKDTNIKILPDDITERDGFVVQNKSYDKPTLKKFMLLNTSPNTIYRFLAPSKKKNANTNAVLVPFVLKESDI